MKQLSLIEKTFMLKDIKIFSSLELDLLLAISEKVGQDFYNSNEVVFDIGQMAYQMYIVAKGSVILEANATKKILKEKSIFGDESLFSENPRRYRATCTTNTLLLTLSRTNLLNILSECPSVSLEFLHIYTKNMGVKDYEN